MACEHMGHLGPRDLVVVDRGYAGYWVFQMLRRHGAHFCARLSSDWWHVVRSFRDSGQTEQTVSLSPSPASLPHCQRLGLSTDALAVRLIRVVLPTGEIEVLATSLLDPLRYPAELFADLYAKRWPIEEAYKALKCRVDVEKFSGKSVETVLQDFHAKLLTMALTAVFAWVAQHAVAQTTAHRVHRYKVNLTQALCTMKQSLALLLSPAGPPDLLATIVRVMASHIQPVRPGRSFSRNHTIHRRAGIPCYKPLC